ncbi:hypothetical protein LZ554_005108 [Drepanopeziza brunnea f. sp. 'monogermtubi']|nr:hypothetical protein LZ554_005108 [Drepanopeziza brunnea f. sp. 'monogermtubi']
MNRFRAKRKAKDGAPDTLVRVSTDSDVPPPPVKASKTFRLGGKKVQEPEPKPEIDLSTALPSTNDFRTSLLMSGLSARFSMLREQDGPESKVGKASDDSVLFSKRQSRYNDFSFSAQNLTDIAEVSSLNGSIRPPFAYGRTESFAGLGSEWYGSDADSTHGSIMSRAKPGEGNNLFGGRQKIMMGNRALYDNDVSQSAFQKIREKGRELKEQESQLEEVEAESSRPRSPPPPGYNRNRDTSSTTSSVGPSITRSSTAATSFTSQRTPSLNGGHAPSTPAMAGNAGLERSATKTRRLYETGLDNHLHEQQFSAMHRIDTLTRQRTLGANTPPTGISPIYGQAPADRWERSITGKQSMPNLQTASPPLSGTTMGTFDFGVRKNSNAGSKPYGMASPPLSPPMTEYDRQGILPLQPNDRGTATAMGAFSKPAPYDDIKYSQRQIQMQQDREAPAPPRKNSVPRALIPQKEQQQQQEQQLGNMKRAGFEATHAPPRSRSNSSARGALFTQDRILGSPTSKSSVAENEATSLGNFLESPDSASAPSNDFSTEPSRHKNYPKPLDLSQMFLQDQRSRIQRPDESQHPANRPRVDQNNAAPIPALIPANMRPISVPSVQLPVDSPTLPGTGLSGLVRSHLRSDSTTSSVYGGPLSASPVSGFPTDSRESVPHSEYSTKNNPWENDDWDRESNYGEDTTANLLDKEAASPPPCSGSVRLPKVDSPGKASWEREMKSRHTREASTETQKEDQEFRNELASRKRRVKEVMQSLQESESRSTSPMPPHPSDFPKDAHQAKNNALGLLKTKTSKGSLAPKTKEAGTSKAMKLLGIGNATISSGSGLSPSPRNPRFEDCPWTKEDEELEPVCGSESTPPQDRACREARRAAPRDRERQVAMRHQRRAGQGDTQDWPVQRKEGERPRPGIQRIDDSWVKKNSSIENSRMEDSVCSRMENSRLDNQMENSRVEPRSRYPEQAAATHMTPPHRTPSRDRKYPPLTYANRNGGTVQESREIRGASRSASRPPSTAPSNASRDRSGSDASCGRSKSRTGTRRDDLGPSMAEGTTQAELEDRGLYPPTRLMPKPPPGVGHPASPSPLHSPMMTRSNSQSTTAGYFEQMPSLQMNMEGFDIGSSPRPSPSAPFVANATPALSQPSQAGSGTNTPASQEPQGPIRPTMRKKSINKSDISEPKFISSTSRMPTVDLPSGLNGTELNAPPIPPVNPKRRQTRTMFGGLMGRRDDDEVQPMPTATQSTEEISTFSADEGENKSKTRGRLRKSSSEGGNLNARARQAANAASSPPMPETSPAGSGPPLHPVVGAMF